MDVFNTFIELLRQTGNVTKGQADINESWQVDHLLLLNLVHFLLIGSCCALLKSCVFIAFGQIYNPSGCS